VEIVLAMYGVYNTGDMHPTLGFFTLDVDVFPDASVFSESDPLAG
jgi:hypothetical protein